MLDNIIQIKGNVKFPITLDPGVWIFDDRRVDLNTYFDDLDKEKTDELTAYKMAVSKHWDREILEGASIPTTTSNTKQKFEKEKLLTGTFGIPLKPFLKNAEPDDTAHFLLIELDEKEVEIPVEEAFELILGFSKEGKPLNEDGPVHVYYGDGSNKENPFKNVKGFLIR